MAYLALILACPLALAAQCKPQWLPGEGLSGVLGAGNGVVRATAMWDPDGAGPLTPRLVVGGNFATAGSVDAGSSMQLRAAHQHQSADGDHR